VTPFSANGDLRQRHRNRLSRSLTQRPAAHELNDGYLADRFPQLVNLNRQAAPESAADISGDEGSELTSSW